MMELVERQIQRFVVTGTLGAGGMGVVLRAHDPQLERDVAIKLLAPVEGSAATTLSGADTLDLRTDAVPGRDLLHEARVMARLSHPNVLPVYEAGLTEGAMFLVMECVDGRSLTEWLATSPPREAIVSALHQAARGIVAAHERDVVHGDIKPNNILVGYDGRVRVADFGLARMIAQSARSSRPRIMGTPDFMAPELWNGELATKSSDVFAFSKTIASSLSDIPADLAELLARGLHLDPRQRPAMAEIVRHFELPAPPSSRPRRRFWLVAPAILAAALIAAIAFTLDDEPTAVPAACGPLEPRLSRTRLDNLRALFAARSDPASASREVTEIERQAEDIRRAVAAACRVRDAGMLACLQRRHIELASRVAFAEATPRETSASLFWSAETCAGARWPPITNGTAAAYARYLAALHVDDDQATLRSLEQTLRESEPELAARIARTIGQRLGYADRLADADAAYLRAYRTASAIGAPALAAAILANRIDVAIARGDAATATELAKQVVFEDGDRALPSGVAVVVLGRTAAAAKERGDAVVAIAHAHAGLAHARTLRAPVTDEIQLWFTLVSTMLDVPALRQTAVKVASEAAIRIGAIDGIGPNLAAALDTLANALRYTNEPAFALAQRYHALALAIATLPAESARIAIIRGRLANDLLVNARFEEAEIEVRRVLAAIERNERLVSRKSEALYVLATLEAERDEHDAALRHAAEAHEAAIAKDGVNGSWTDATLLKLAELELEAGDLDAADRHIAALGAKYRARTSERDRLAFAALRGTAVARLALLRGRPREAERAARAALATLREEPPSDDLLRTSRNLALSLLAQRRTRQARSQLADVLALAQRLRKPPRFAAEVELALARAEELAGDRAGARARVARIANELGPQSRRDLDRVLSPSRR